jgi:hypothetical protein
MSGTKKTDNSHEILSNAAKNDVEQPGDTPKDTAKKSETDDALRETD